MQPVIHRKFKVKDATSEQLADSIEAGAMRDLYKAAPASLCARTLRVGGADVLMIPTLPSTFFNRVIGLGSSDPVRVRNIDDITALYTAAGVSDYWIHIGPSAQPDLGSLLASRGFTLAQQRSWAKFLRPVEPPSSPDGEFVLREAGADDADAVAQVVCTAFGMPASLVPWFASLVGRPGWQVWVATSDGRVVATGSMFVSGETAWLGIAATLAEYRGRGAQSGLIAARIRAASHAGCRVLATETGEPVGTEANPSLLNIRRAGFRQVSSRLNYASQGGPPVKIRLERLRCASLLSWRRP